MVNLKQEHGVKGEEYLRKLGESGLRLCVTRKKEAAWSRQDAWDKAELTFSLQLSHQSQFTPISIFRLAETHCPGVQQKIWHHDTGSIIGRAQ